MPNYQLSKIYRIEPNNSDCDGDVYYGSSCEPYLSRRIDGHRSAYKRWLNGKNSKVMVYELFEKYGVENCSIVLVEKFPCDSREELHARERFYIKNNKCVNKYIPLRSKKDYYIDNVDKIKERITKPLNCVCGSIICIGDKAKHFKTLKHLEYIEQEQNIEN